VTQGSGFYFHVQSYGEWENGHWKIWRFPTVPEHKAITMLALSHGTDGLIQGQYDSYPGMKGIIREGPGYDTTDIWYSLRDNIIPRIKGELGSTLLSIDYTGDYLYLGRYLQDLCCGFTTTSSTVTERYLTLSELSESTPPTLHYHTGFFEKQNQPNNNYFLLTNLITTANRSVNVELTDDNSAFINTRFRNVETENNFDTTFTDVFSIDMTIPPGEGYLYQVAPVALYGGRLLYDENVGEGQVLIDDMIIENGATMTVYSTYNANANITVKHGTIQLGENGKIIFGEGKKIIIEGACTINGTSGDKLQLVFSEILNDEEPTGIMIKAGGSLTINNCKIENATIGIESLLNANYLNVQKVDFINCSEIAVSIAGYGSNQILTPPTPQIMYCTIQNSKNGIWATNLSQIVIRENQITNTERGIYLSNVATPAVIGNNITGTNELAGIFMESCNGVVRGNRITSHTNAIHLGNSSPDVGGNTLFHNWNRGIYVGVGSLPNMRARLVQDPIHPNLFYAVSGYNRIYENGGWSEEDDGSEIFIYDANVLLGKGCNEITDQRLPNIEETPPLYNTRLLMNCIFSQQFFDIKAGGNFWDEHPIYPLEERFGDCIVYYEPILEEPCPQPDGSSGKLAITSASGETIDTLYAEERDVGTLSVTEQLYASAEEMFLTADFDGAELIYNQIVSGTDSVDVKLDAYRRLSEIGKLTGRDEIYFSELRDMYSSLAGSSSDSSLVKIFSHLSTLSLVAHQEYVPAVGEFDGIIQQNPNTEEAVYAEIDALTTALLIEETDTTLQKGRLGKYLIKSSADYNQKVDEILRKNFGSNSTENEKELLPTEYTLYQNYPNPFNPATTIKYDLPNASEVSLIIYDILGRKVKELVNTKQQAGRYEIQFNASNLASGVYIYQLMTDNPSTSSGQGFISSKKMILLK